MKELNIRTHGEGMVDITEEVKTAAGLLVSEKQSGVLTLFIKHTSAALTISEAFDPSAREDIEHFLKHLAPRNLGFIKHTAEGPDDSPSHMKSILLNPFLSIIIEKGQLVLGTWQGIYLAEFRDGTHTRTLAMQFIEQNNTRP